MTRTKCPGRHAGQRATFVHDSRSIRGPLPRSQRSGSKEDGERLYSSSERKSDADPVVNAVDPLSLLDKYTESGVLVGPFHKAGKLNDAIVHSEANAVIIDPGSVLSQR
jgi:hypothetical protein